MHAMMEQTTRKTKPVQNVAPRWRGSPSRPMAMPASAKGACSCGGQCPRCRARAVAESAALDGRQQDNSSSPTTLRSLAAARQSWKTSDEGQRARQVGAAFSGVATGIDGRWLGAKLGHGKPLDRATRARMEDKFGEDFSDVRIHAGHEADVVTKTLNASALTVGRHIAFAQGMFNPRQESGRRLLAHELAHTVQQKGVSHIPSGILPITRPGHRSEREADVASRSAVSSLTGNGPAISRATGAQVSPSVCGVLVEAVAWGATSALVAAVAVGCTAGSVVTFGGLAIPCTALVIGSAAVGAIDAVLWTNILKEAVCGEHVLSEASAPETGGAPETAQA